jgi:hypothetical protein
LILNSLFAGVAHLLMRFSPLFWALYGIGFVIPAIIAHDMFRQGPFLKTLMAVLAKYSHCRTVLSYVHECCLSRALES